MPLTKATQAVIAPNICTTDTAQTITGEKTFTQAIIADLTGDVTGDLTGNVTGNVTATSVSTTNLVNGSSLCFRNKIINGNFDIWQRGTSLGSGTGARYLADRFVNSSIGSTYTVSQQLFSNGQTDVLNNPSYFHRTVVSSVAGNGNHANFATTIESVKNLAGKTATLSFYAKADSNKSVSVEFQQFFGTGGSPSSQLTGIGVQKLNLTSSWQNFTVTVNIPSIAGKTIGTNNNDYLAVAFWFDAGSDWNSRTNSLGQQSGTFDIAQVQLEEGSVATPFEIRPIGTELALCQRYYEKSYNESTPPGTITASGMSFVFSGGVGGVAQIVIPTFYKVKKRAIPTVVLYSPSTGAVGNMRDFGSLLDKAASANANSGESVMQVQNDVASSGNAQHGVHYTASAEF